MSGFNGEMVEREEPRFITFNGEGDMVEGQLFDIERVRTKDGTAIRYTVEQPDGEMVSFLGTFKINSKIRPNDKGHYVKVIYAGENKTVTKAGNSMREFVVKVSKAKVVRGASGDFLEVTTSTTGVEITDDDIGL